MNMQTRYQRALVEKNASTEMSACSKKSSDRWRCVCVWGGDRKKTATCGIYVLCIAGFSYFYPEGNLRQERVKEKNFCFLIGSLEISSSPIDSMPRRQRQEDLSLSIDERTSFLSFFSLSFPSIAFVHVPTTRLFH